MQSNTSESTSTSLNVTPTNEAALLQPLIFQANLQKLLKEELPDVDIKPILIDATIPVRSKKKRRKSETGKNVKAHQQNKSLHNKSNSIKSKSTNVSKSQRARITKTDDQQVDDWLYGESAKIEGDEQEEDLRQEIENVNDADKVDDEDEEDSVNVAIDSASKSGPGLDGDESEITAKVEMEEAGEEGGEGGNEDEDGDEDDEEDSDDDIVVTIGDIKAAPAAAAGIAGQAPFGTKRPAGPPPDKKGKFAVEDFEGTGTINGVPAQDFSLDSIEEKPWRKPGADLTDYFNYGFTEETWRAYCDRQKRLRYESGSSAPTMDRERKHHPQGGSHAMIPIVGSDNSKYNGPPNVIFPKKFGMQDRQKDGQRIQRSRDEHRENTIQVMTADRREYSRKTFDMPPPPMGPPPFDMSVPPPPRMDESFNSFPPDMYRGPPDFFNHPPPQYYPEEHIDYEQQWMDNAWEMKGPGPSHVVPLTKVANLPPPPGESDDVLSKRTPPRKDDK